MNKNILLITLLFIVNIAANEVEISTKPNKNETSENISIGTLKQLLADQYLLLTKTFNYHWNITGPEFNDYHLMFNEQYEKLFKDVDKTAERIRSLNTFASGTLKQFLNITQLNESSEIPSPKEMVKNILQDYQKIILSIKKGLEKIKNINDPGTVHFLCKLVQEYEKTTWMLQSLLA